jgi:hypothetical protein
MACKPLVSRRERDVVVSPSSDSQQEIIAPVNEEFDDLDGDSEVAETEDHWEELADKYEDLEKKVHEYLDDENKTDARNPPVARIPSTMTREQWTRHQVTHTPYAPGCKHCVAARAIRRRHPKKRRHNVIVPDIDGSVDGPTKVSMDYMYLSERNKDDQDIGNPPHLVIVDHRHGRVWAHRVPQKGIMGKVEWVPRQVIQDPCNNGMQNKKVQVKIDQEPSM